MKTQHSQKGFTLVELAIVMTIIGLLIGGILKGQELMENARVTSTIAQVKSYQAATTTFRDQYSAFPGDMVDADTRLPNCAAATCEAGGIGTPGDSIVGALDGFAANQSATIDEPTLFWTHLLKADLISGVTDAALNAGTVAWGNTHPSANIAGGFTVGHASGATQSQGVGADLPTGLVLSLVTAPADTHAGLVGAGAGAMPLSPLRAAQIDRKMDDGRSNGGSVVSYGLAATCASGANNDTYLESSTSRDCGLIFGLDG